MIHLSELRALADAASEGPWFDCVNDLIGGRIVRTVDAPASARRSRRAIDVADFLAENNAAYIAALPPEVARALLDAVEAAQDVLDYNTQPTRAALSRLRSGPGSVCCGAGKRTAVSARDLYAAGDLCGAARAEAKACDRDGYDITAAILRDLADQIEREALLDPREYDLRRLRVEASDLSVCPNKPDESGEYPCDPKVLLGLGMAECQVCGRVAAWGAA